MSERPGYDPDLEVEIILTKNRERQKAREQQGGQEGREGRRSQRIQQSKETKTEKARPASETKLSMKPEHVRNRRLMAGVAGLLSAALLGTMGSIAFGGQREGGGRGEAGSDSRDGQTISLEDDKLANSNNELADSNKKEVITIEVDGRVATAEFPPELRELWEPSLRGEVSSDHWMPVPRTPEASLLMPEQNSGNTLSGGGLEKQRSAEQELAQNRAENYQRTVETLVAKLAETEGTTSVAYVPTHEGVASELSGVTGTHGFDFYGKTEKMLADLGFSSESIARLLPYTANRGQEAVNYLANHPLTFTEAELKVMEQANVKMILDKQLEFYREKGTELLDLPPEMIITIVQPVGLYGYNDFSDWRDEKHVFGELARMQENVVAGDWSGVAKNYQEIIRQYRANSGEAFNAGWANRHESYLEDYVAGMERQFPELRGEVMMA